MRTVAADVLIVGGGAGGLRVPDGVEVVVRGDG